MGYLDKIDYEEGRWKAEEKLAEVRSEIGEMGDPNIPITQIFEKSMKALEHKKALEIGLLDLNFQNIL